MAYKHMGATTGPWQYSHDVKCYYSRNTGRLTSTKKELTYEEQKELNFKFMQNVCKCDRCVEEREHRARLKQRLLESNAQESLRAMGW